MPDSQENNGTSNDVIDAEIVDAEIVSTDLGNGKGLHPTVPTTSAYPDSQFHGESLLDTNVNHLSAKGGAVGGVLLAVLGLVGMTFSSYSFVNVLLAILFSIWGLKSPLRKTAIVGLLIALAGLITFFVRFEH